MNSNSINDYSDIINKIIFFTKNEKVKDSVIKVYKKYSEIREKNKNNFVQDVLENLKWVAEERKSAQAVKKAAKFYLLDPVLSICTKYSGDIADEIFESLEWCIGDSLDENTVKNYALWMNNGHIGKLLDFAADLNGNGNVKLKRDILSILFVKWSKTDEFNVYASKINSKKLLLEEKVKLLSILRDIVNTNRENYADILVDGGIEQIGKILHDDLNAIKNFNDTASIKTGIRFLSDMKRVENADFLFQKCREFGSVKKWLHSDPITRKVIDKMKEAGFDTDLYVTSGKTIAQTKGDGHYSEDWTGAFKSIVIKILGSKKNRALPSISIPNIAPGSFYKKIEGNYRNAVNGDKDSAKKVLKEIKISLIKNFAKRRMPQTAIEILNDIEMLDKVLDYGGTLTFRGAKVVAKVWKREIPNDLYDSEILRCCIFLPNGEQMHEMPLFMMDPQTTLVQFYVQGIGEPIAAATFYAGISDGKPVLFMDTWEAGSLAYAALSYEKMQNFALDTMKKLAEKVGAKRLLIFAEAEYGRPEEFCAYLRDRGFKSKKTYFELIDSNDTVLRHYSKKEKHHLTDAFENKPISGKVKTFNFDI